MTMRWAACLKLLPNMSLGVALVAIVIATGCASVSMGPEAIDAEAKLFAHTGKQAELYIYRNETLAGGIPFFVRLDGYMVGMTASKTYLHLSVPAGRHTLESEGWCDWTWMASRPPCNKTSFDFDASPGQLLFIWQEMKSGGLSIVGGPKSILHIVDAETGKKGVLECKLAQAGGVSPLQGSTATSTIEAVDWSPDGKFIVALSGGKVRVVDSLTSQSVTELLTPEKRLPSRDKFTAVAFSQDGKRLATASEDELVLWDTQNWQSLSRAETPGQLNSIIFDPSGSKLLGVGPWANLTIWNTITGKMTTLPDSRAHAITVSANSEFVATGDELGQIRILSLPGMAWVANAKQDTPVSGIDFTSDGKGLLATSRGIVLRAWRFYGDRLEEDKTMFDARSEAAERAHKSKAGIEAFEDIIMLIAEGREMQLAGAPGPTASAAVSPKKGLSSSMKWGVGPCPMHLRSDGARLTIATCFFGYPEAGGYQVEVWDVASSRRLDIYKNSGPAHALSPDGKRVAIGIGDQLMIRDVITEASHNLTPP